MATVNIFITSGRYRDGDTKYTTNIDWRNIQIPSTEHFLKLGPSQGSRDNKISDAKNVLSKGWRLNFEKKNTEFAIGQDI